MPDVRARFEVEIIANKVIYPTLLSNGNLVQCTDMNATQQRCVWNDPYPKPSYLFALVAGAFGGEQGVHIRQDGKAIPVKVMIEDTLPLPTSYALNVALSALRWDEVRYGLPYDLDAYHLVGVQNFNAGAMENKGVNIFNLSTLVGDTKTRTDEDLERIVHVVSHELAHNYAGDRVGPRDWFQLSLKEGLATAKEYEFVEYWTNSPLSRIQQIQYLRNTQFGEDAGPLAHPVQPDHYTAIDNFYTPTIYAKGAEILQMIKGVLGDAVWVSSLRHYFQQYDHQSVTIEDFLASLSEHSGQDLRPFHRWYTQVGTPHVRFSEAYNSDSQTYTLWVNQSHTPPLPIPIKVALWDKTGHLMPGTDKVLMLTEAQQSFVFQHVPEKPIPSLFRGFSAPVVVESTPVTPEDALFLLQHESDVVTRWDIASQLIEADVRGYVMALHQQKPYSFHTALWDALERILQNDSLSGGVRVAMISLPNAHALLEASWPMPLDPSLVYEGLEQYQRAMSIQHQATYQHLLALSSTETMDARAFHNGLLERLSYLPDFTAPPLPEREAFNDFYEGVSRGMRFGMTPEVEGALKGLLASQNPLWVQYGLQLRAQDTSSLAISHLSEVIIDYKNPNQVRGLMRPFSTLNPRFHDASGKGYRLLANTIATLDAINPEAACRLVAPLTEWKGLAEPYRTEMQKALQSLQTKQTSVQVQEVVEKGLL
jgi:aminopeptidase N